MYVHTFYVHHLNERYKIDLLGQEDVSNRKGCVAHEASSFRYERDGVGEVIVGLAALAFDLGEGTKVRENAPRGVCVGVCFIGQIFAEI